MCSSNYLCALDESDFLDVSAHDVHLYLHVHVPVLESCFFVFFGAFFLGFFRLDFFLRHICGGRSTSLFLRGCKSTVLFSNPRLQLIYTTRPHQFTTQCPPSSNGRAPQSNSCVESLPNTPCLPALTHMGIHTHIHTRTVYTLQEQPTCEIPCIFSMSSSMSIACTMYGCSQTIMTHVCGCQWW